MLGEPAQRTRRQLPASDDPYDVSNQTHVPPHRYDGVGHHLVADTRAWCQNFGAHLLSVGRADRLAGWVPGPQVAASQLAWSAVGPHCGQSSRTWHLSRIHAASSGPRMDGVRDPAA